MPATSCVLSSIFTPSAGKTARTHSTCRWDSKLCNESRETMEKSNPETVCSSTILSDRSALINEIMCQGMRKCSPSSVRILKRGTGVWLPSRRISAVHCSFCRPPYLLVDYRSGPLRTGRGLFRFISFAVAGLSCSTIR